MSDFVRFKLTKNRGERLINIKHILQVSRADDEGQTRLLFLNGDSRDVDQHFEDVCTILDIEARPQQT